MHYPLIDPVLIWVGPLAIRWYGISYVAAFLTCYILGVYRAKRTDTEWNTDQWSDLVFFGIVGTLLGGRIGYVIFYGWDSLVSDPLLIFRIWEGGMSFHGGLLGVIGALYLWARKRKVAFLLVTDFVAPLVSIGIGFGRLGNFANTELPGRVTESFLGAYFPCTAVWHLNPTCLSEYETVTRHISSLYQAIVTGVIVFAVVWLFSSKKRPIGMVSGLFLAAYGVGRILTECFREPDVSLGFLVGNWLTMGQLLSIPLIVLGIVVMALAIKDTSNSRNRA